jgi:hypothetical protein
LSYFRQGTTVPAYSRLFTYYSQRIGPERDEAALSRWVSNGESPYRTAADEAVIELVDMMKEHFLAPSNTAYASSPKARIKFWEPLEMSEREETGTLLHEQGNRIRFQGQSLGNLFSLVPDSIQRM